MSFSSNENQTYYSLFGPSEPQIPRQVINNDANKSRQPFMNSTNLIQRPQNATSLQSIPRESQNSTKLFVGNLPAETTLNELTELFGKFGRINLELSVVKEENYAFIHFYKQEEAQVACNELNNSLFKNRYIRVQYSTSLGHMTKKSKSSDAYKKIPQSQSLFAINSNQISSASVSASSSSTDLKPIGRPIRGSIKSSSNNELIQSSQSIMSTSTQSLNFNPFNYSNFQYLYAQNLAHQQTMLNLELQLKQLQDEARQLSHFLPSSLSHEFLNFD